jgi:NADH-quinone oxidoreductase subunit L
MTAFYMFRLWIVTFTGELKDQHAHESPAVMTVPLMILAFMSVTAGLAGMPWLKQNVFTFLYFRELHEVEFNLGMAVKSNIVAICGIGLAVLIYGMKVIKAETMKKITGPLYTLSKNKFYFDEMYLALINIVFITLTEAVKWFDRHVVDGAVNMVSFLTRWSGIKLRYTMTGRVQNYALIIFSGLIIAIVAFAVYNPDALKIFGGR